ncbi:hypothetical protein, partial [Ralstonia solanacearum]|uniref:hypothetical protein n=1 Tax=Ralstonia solanacearum TaxID=305 RepID=UPI002480DB59
AKAAILSQVGQVYFGGWVSFTSALTRCARAKSKVIGWGGSESGYMRTAYYGLLKEDATLSL